MEDESSSCKIVYIERMLYDNEIRKASPLYTKYGAYAEHVETGAGERTYIFNHRPSPIGPGELVKVMRIAGRGWYKEVVDEDIQEAV